MALTEQQYAQQMVAQLRILDPSISAEVGTPERAIIDTVAQALAEGQVNLSILGGALDVTSKYGDDLDAFVGAVAAFGRQSGAYSTGTVTFSRSTASPFNISIPNGTQVQASITTTAQGLTNTQAIVFQTTRQVTLAAGDLSVDAPIQALIKGALGNVAAATITTFANIGTPPLGITAVTNASPTVNGADRETDAELKVRFQNTAFRNQAGTIDQYMALALATQFSTKANVIGPISRYQEYIQVPLADDSEIVGSPATVTANGSQVNGVPTLAVTALSGGTPLVGDAISGTGLALSSTIVDISGSLGDASLTYTLSSGAFSSTVGPGPFTVLTGEPDDGTGAGLPDQWTTTPSNNPFAKAVYTNVPYFISNGGVGADTVFYRQSSDFVMNSPPINKGDTYRESQKGDIANPIDTPFRPNVTFFSVYQGADETVTLPTPGAVVLFEYSYLSAESRNDLTRNIDNCVDVYVNGQNPTLADVNMPTPTGATPLFVNNPVSPFYYLNYRRIGLPDTAPALGNLFTGLFWQPVIDLPTSITIGATTYTLGIDYWGVQEVSELGGTVRARNGIEWAPAVVSNPVPLTTVSGYTFDKNLIDLQAALDAKTQITTDVLAHGANTRYFKLDLTVVYSSGASPAAVNLTIQSTIATFFNGQYFGSTIQLSDLLVLVRNVQGVQNVRWSNDVVNPADVLAFGTALHRVTETDINGNPRQLSVTGTSAPASKQLTGVALVIPGVVPQIGWVLTSPSFPPDTFITDIIGSTYTLSEAPLALAPTGAGTFTFVSAFDNDFYLRDSELPSLPSGALSTDSVAGLIIRPRAQGTFGYF